MSDERLPVKHGDTTPAFTHRAVSPLVRRGLERLSTAAALTADPRFLWTFTGYGRRGRTDHVPTALPVRTIDIPHELTERPQWVCWDWAWKGDRWGKPPIDPKTGGSASADDRRTWGRFAEAVTFAERHRLPGIGYFFAYDDPFTGVDLDHCRSPTTGELESWAAQIVAELDSYAEVSPSGRGLHVIVQGTVPRHYPYSQKARPEVYDKFRYFAMTGHCLEGAARTIAERQDKLSTLAIEPPEIPSPSDGGYGDGPSLFVSRATRDLVLVATWDGCWSVLNAQTGAERWSWWDSGEISRRGETNMPVLSDGNLVVNQDGSCVARDAFSGVERWRLGDDGQFEAITLSVVEDLLLITTFGSGGGHLRGVEASNGRELWCIDISPDSVVRAIGDTIYVADGGTLSAVDVSYGYERWGTMLGGIIRPNWGGAAAVITEIDQVVCIVTQNVDKTVSLIGLNAVNGEVLWRTLVLEAPSGPYSADNANLCKEAANGTIFYNVFEELGPHAIDVQTGTQLWSLDDGDWLDDPVVTPDTVFVSSAPHSGNLLALDTRTGYERWVIDGDWQPLAVVDGVVVASDVSSYVYDDQTERTLQHFCAFGSETGRPLWQSVADEQLVISNGIVYVGGQGTVRALEARSGRELWRCPISANAQDRNVHVNIAASEAISLSIRSLDVVNDTVFVSTDHSLCAIRVPRP